MSRDEDLARIKDALQAAGEIVARFSPAAVDVRFKSTNSPVTDADMAADRVLRSILPGGDEGWLSEESPDDRARLTRRRVWIVDPLDGTREFLEGTPHWTVAIGLAEDGEVVAGGVYNPSTKELFLGAPETGTTLNGEPVRVSVQPRLAGGTVLTNRWALRKRPDELRDKGFAIRKVDALAYSLALIASGRADALWSRSPKAEWDTAAGVALIAGAGGLTTDYQGRALRFNAWPPHASGLIATNRAIRSDVRRFIARLPRPRR